MVAARVNSKKFWFLVKRGYRVVSIIDGIANLFPDASLIKMRLSIQ